MADGSSLTGYEVSHRVSDRYSFNMKERLKGFKHLMPNDYNKTSRTGRSVLGINKETGNKIM